jgi:hypothetical protein
LRKFKENLQLYIAAELREIFGPKRDEVTGGWRKLHNEKLNIFYSLPRRMRWAGHVTQMGRTGMHREYWWESQKRPLGRPRCW